MTALGINEGAAEIVVHTGFLTHAFKAPMIHNRWFENAGVNAISNATIRETSCGLNAFNPVNQLVQRF